MQSRKYVRNVAAFGLIFSLCIINSGCTDLKSIRKFTESATEISKGFPKLANDLSASCKRQHVLQQISQNQFDPQRLIAITHPDPGSRDAKDLAFRCRSFTEAEKPLIKANAVLMDYLEAMGALAADELTNFDKGVEGLGGGLTKAGLFTDKEAGAVSKIASFILRAATEGYRRKKLKTALEENNAHIQTLTNALQRIIAQRYVLQLKNERDQMRSYYIGSILKYREYMTAQARMRQSSHSNGSNGRRVFSGNAASQGLVEDPLPIINVKRIWDEDEANLIKKIEAAQAYGQAVAKIGEGHQKLYDERNNLSSKEVLQLAASYGKTVKSLVDDFREAF